MKLSLSTLRSNSQRSRMALIPILCLVLGAVLFWPKADAPQGPSSVAADTQLVSRGPNAAKVVKATNPWPTFDIDQVVAFDPFDPLGASSLLSAASSSFNESDGPSDTTTLNPAMAGKLQAIYRDSRGAAAILDSRIVHVGDQLPGGGRVIAINPDEVVVTNQ